MRVDQVLGIKDLHAKISSRCRTVSPEALRRCSQRYFTRDVLCRCFTPPVRRGKCGGNRNELREDLSTFSNT